MSALPRLPFAFPPAAAALLALAALGCEARGPGGADNVVNVEDDDAAMNAAVAEARATVGRFTAALADPAPGQVGFSVKLPVTEGETTEHMWLDAVRYEPDGGGRFRGVLNNEPRGLTGVSLGDELTVPADGISDWMYVEDGRLAGGYTIRALRDRLPPGERAAFEAQAPFRFE